MISAVTIELCGIVQGVGFRPAVYRLAVRLGLCGWVRNCSGRVLLRLEGERPAIDAFRKALPESLPVQARVDSMTTVACEELPAAQACSTFEIIASADGDASRVTIPADLAMCSACAREVTTPGGRRYRYPFTTCTDCGPRYTVVTGMPYDRVRTTMSVFPLCEACRAEYEDPRDRRFHAESIACPECGPTVSFVRPGAGQYHVVCTGRDAVDQARTVLREGQLLAARGIGGFQIAADARNRQALQKLRDRKNRPDKPFAVMCRDLGVVRRICCVPPAAAEALASPRAPIVILDVRPGVDTGLPLDLLSPDTATLGVMLPTTPLHTLLFGQEEDAAAGGGFDILVMTSGNRGGEPICTCDADVRDRLAGIVDAVLTHDREINLRNDDSVGIVQRGQMQVWRRARGYAPEPVKLHRPLRTCVLAMGAELKNTIALGYDHEVVLSPYIGDLATPEALDGFETVVSQLPRFLSRNPQCIAVDLHPDMHSSRIGRKIAESLLLPVVAVQHHAAHGVSCMAEHGLDCALALVFDGTGMGDDGTVWGAELFEIVPDGWKRLATFEPARLPGGDAAVLQPVRQVVARLLQAGVTVDDAWFEAHNVEPTAGHAWKRQCERRLNAPVTHAAGRVFDAFAACIGVAPATVSYEGQAAIRLEALARSFDPANGSTPQVPFDIREHDGMVYVDWAPAFRMLAGTPIPDSGKPAWARGVHVALAAAAVEMIEFGLTRTVTRDIVLTGGCFMNRLLTDELVERLAAKELTAWIHHTVPPNDGGIALGQAATAGGQSIRIE